ncbi:hypothetical protein [Yoonia sp. 208BN28-4]|uniref:hypothetical protein n=1 Tax=Yoonia sp. 208BN28-4 TaxID=3126505 RepID=UPI0030A57AA8
MANTANVPFNTRLRRIVRRNNRMVHGTALTMKRDGLIVAQPRIYNPRFPLRGLLLLISVAFLFKGYIYAELGARDYNARVAAMSEGAMIEQAGGWLMAADPATVIVGNFLRELLR